MPQIIVLQIFVALLLLFNTNTSQAQSAQYSIKFVGTWSPNDISSDYPSSAHFSPMIGATHQAGAQFWQNGDRASIGVEEVAELGANDALRSELSIAQNAGTVGATIEFQSLFSLPNSDTVEIEVDRDKPFITLITMIAPSPDWFIGVSGLSLLESDEWVRSLTVELRPYDAGTEEGTTFSLGNPASPDTDRITKLTEADSPFIGRPVIGRLEFTLLNPPVVPPPTEPPTQPPNTDSNSAALPALMGLLLAD